MSPEIRIDYGYVLGLKSSTEATAGRLRVDERELGGTPSDDRVHDRLTKFRRDWDERRDELAGTLEAVAKALGAIHDSFEATDQQLTTELSGTGEGR